MITKVLKDPTTLCNISLENSKILQDLADSIELNKILTLQSNLKVSENNIRHSSHNKLWLEIHLI